MKPILFLVSLSLIASTSIAQRFSSGLRTGIDYIISQNDWHMQERSGSGLGWNKSAFVRYESKSRFAADLNFAHSRFNYTYSTSEQTEFAPPTHETVEHRSNNDAFTGNLAIQMRVTNRQSPIKSYFGAGISGGKEVEHNKVVRRDIQTKEITKGEWTYFGGLAFCGFNNYTSYAINKHLNIHSAVSFYIDPSHALSSFRPRNQFPESRLSWSIGCGYIF